jgi:prepilin-type processing-associated H-X9-DG protein
MTKCTRGLGSQDHYWCPTQSGGSNVDGTLSPYSKNRNLFMCPSIRTQYVGYAINTLNWGTGSPTPFYGQADSAIQEPAETIAYLDGDGSPSMGGEFETPADILGGIPTRHNEGCVVGFADGHVKYFTPQALIKAPPNMWSVEVD